MQQIFILITLCFNNYGVYKPHGEMIYDIDPMHNNSFIYICRFIDE